MTLLEIYETFSSEDIALKIQEAQRLAATIVPRIQKSLILWEEYAPKIYNIISQLDSPEYETERRIQLIKSYSKWGSYGWTYCMKVPLTQFGNEPKSLIEADTYMQKYCTFDTVTNIKNRLSEISISKDDLEEAFDCYQNKRYKACSLILFSIIDNLLISRGIIKRQKKAVGLSAIKEIKSKEQSEFEKNPLIAYFIFLNIMECLTKMFESGNDFKEQPEVINRNFVAHGMYQKKITDLDCFKVWSALYSLAILLPIAEDLVNANIKKGAPL